MAESVPPGGGKGFLRRAAERARQAADTLRDEYRKGQAGDDSPVRPIAPSAVDVLKAWMNRDAGATSEPTGDTGEPAETGETGEAGTTNEPAEARAAPAADGDDPGEAAEEVASLLDGVNWRRVADAAKDSTAVQRMRELADQVDWAAAKPVASRVASVLIAAAAAGELGGLQGATGRYVARTIANEMGLADRVAQRLQSQRSNHNRTVIDYIDATASESSAPGATASFDTRLGELRGLGGPAQPGDAPTG